MATVPASRPKSSAWMPSGRSDLAGRSDPVGTWSVGPAPGGFSNWGLLLDLILASFAYMDGRIDPPSSAHTLTADSLRTKAGSEHLFLASSDATLVGCAFFAPRPDCLYLGKLAVIPRYQGRGIGRALVAAGVALGRGLELTEMRLQSRIELVENHRAFQAMGFVRVGETAHAGFDRSTSVTMALAL